MQHFKSLDTNFLLHKTVTRPDIRFINTEFLTASLACPVCCFTCIMPQQASFDIDKFHSFQK